jgi:hypothetical protein
MKDLAAIGFEELEITQVIEHEKLSVIGGQRAAAIGLTQMSMIGFGAAGPFQLLGFDLALLTLVPD